MFRSRISQLKTICILLILLSSVRCTRPTPVSTSPSKPNIIFILADDLGYGDTEPYGQQQIQTPHIAQLAKEGMLFRQFYAGSTVCAPSRSVLMTGLHTGHTRVRGNLATATLLPADTTLAERLKAMGYRTALVGKWGLGDKGTPGIPNKKGFDYFYGFLNQTHAHNHYPDYVWENEQIDSLGNVVEYISTGRAKGIGGIARTRSTYVQDKFVEKAQQFMEQDNGQPFFLYLALTLPHANNEASHFNESGMEVPDDMDLYESQAWPAAQKQHAGMITYLDGCVGRILGKLKILGLDENTIVIFSSDNGPHNEGGARHDFFDSNGPLRGLKRDLFEGGIRVPFIARWPGRIAPNTRSEEVFAFWDVVPTLCEISNAPIPGSSDGISFIPTLTENGKQKKHNFLYWEFHEQNGKQAVRMGDWKCIRLDVNIPGESKVLLFNLGKDPGEQEDVAGKYPDKVKEMTSVMDKEHRYSPEFQFLSEREK